MILDIDIISIVRYASTAVTYMTTARTTRDKFPEEVVTENDIKLKVSWIKEC